jgi:hypothetical protein
MVIIGMVETVMVGTMGTIRSVDITVTGTGGSWWAWGRATDGKLSAEGSEG